jgi:hypothetical protein
MQPLNQLLKVAPSVNPNGMQMNFQNQPQPQGGDYNPGNIPLQQSPVFHDMQPTPYQVPQRQQLYNQQQPQVGVTAHNLAYLAAHAPPTATNGLSPYAPQMVNVGWSNHPVPYSQSLTPPPGWHAPGYKPGQKVESIASADPALQSATPPAPQHQSFLHKLLGMF